MFGTSLSLVILLSICFVDWAITASTHDPSISTKRKRASLSVIDVGATSTNASMPDTITSNHTAPPYQAPITWPVDDTDITLKFTHYGPSPTYQDMYLCLVNALDDALTDVIRLNGDHLIDVDDIDWMAHTVTLYLENLGPGTQRNVRYSHLGPMIRGIAEFMNHYSFAFADFNLVVAGLGHIGTGYIGEGLSGRPPKTTTTTSAATS